MIAKNKREAASDLKWAIRAVASARGAFLTYAYIDRLIEIENSIIAFRNEILQIKSASPVAATGERESNVCRCGESDPDKFAPSQYRRKLYCRKCFRKMIDKGNNIPPRCSQCKLRLVNGLCPIGHAGTGEKENL